MDGALNAAGTSGDKVSMAALAGSGVVYRGMELLRGGAILAGMILGAVAAFIIDRDFDRAAVYALAGAVLAFFGFIHGAKLGVGEFSGVASATCSSRSSAGVSPRGRARHEPKGGDPPSSAADDLGLQRSRRDVAYHDLRLHPATPRRKDTRAGSGPKKDSREGLKAWGPSNCQTSRTTKRPLNTSPRAWFLATPAVEERSCGIRPYGDEANPAPVRTSLHPTRSSCPARVS